MTSRSRSSGTHNDFWTRNLFGDTAQPTTVVDWAFLGAGPMGSDIANMVASAGFDAFVAAEDLVVFSEGVFESYLGGLRQVGWAGDEKFVRRGFWASASNTLGSSPQCYQVFP
jgi:thiamine kinase-like enzyme